MESLGPSRVVVRRFWELVGAGMSPSAAGRVVGVSETTGLRWFSQCGGVGPVFTNPVTTGPRPRLTLGEREEIMAGVAGGESINSIARRLGRWPSTIYREIRRNGTQNKARPAGPVRYRRTYRFGARRSGRIAVVDYRASIAHRRAEMRARRCRPGKLATNDRLHTEVGDRLGLRHSPEQIAGALRVEFPDDPEMRVSHETIYKALYLQGRGALRRELAASLRTGRRLRKPRHPRLAAGEQGARTKFGGLHISARPAEAEDRAVPGHWEGDLIIGADQASAIGTLVERRSGFVVLLHLPTDHTAETVAAATIAKMAELPAILRRTLTWDQGSEMAQHARITMATGLQVYFCDPHSPWQRGSNENTNGLLRQYFPKGTDLSIYPPGYLDYVAAELNNRPRKRHDFRSPTKILNDILTQASTVASTA
jgi:IS30 family transposase